MSAPAGEASFRRWSVWFPTTVAAVSALVGALVGGGVTGFTTWASLQSGRDAQLAQFREDRADKERSVRASAYAAFFEAFDAYNVDVSPLAACLKLPSAEVAQVAACKSARLSLASRSLALRVARDQVSLYGSDEMNRIVDQYMKEFVEILDPASGGLNITILTSDLHTASKRTQDVFQVFINAAGAHKIFTIRTSLVRTACSEVNPLPRTNC
jgi:hypothetical protein